MTFVVDFFSPFWIDTHYERCKKCISALKSGSHIRIYNNLKPDGTYYEILVRMQVARKMHICFWCGAFIKKGDFHGGTIWGHYCLNCIITRKICKLGQTRGNIRGECGKYEPIY